MAVIVQAMVAASAAGVVFSRDSTASRDLILIEAVRGLGDSLVSGRATPELVRVHRATLHVVEHQLVPGLDAPILTEAAIAAIAEAAIRIEGYFEAPQDIEWALDHRGLHILQSRPLTGPKPVISRPAEAEP
jgi:pyruvate,water dikinase